MAPPFTFTFSSVSSSLKPQRPSARHPDCGEGLVDLDELEIGDADLLLLHRKVDGVCRLQLQ